LFSRVEDFAQELLKGERSAKYSPIDVAAWLEDFAGAAIIHLRQAEKRLRGAQSPEFRLLAADVGIQCGIGRFFGAKLRAAPLLGIYNRTGDRASLEEALKAYRTARETWAAMAKGAQSVYAADVTYGRDRHLRGHWLDRLPAIDLDLADMEKHTAASS